MTQSEYRAWANHHCTTFGLFDAREIEMVLSWFGAFEGAGYAVADLRAATDAMRHPGPAPQFRSDHLRLIQIHAGGAARARAKLAAVRQEGNTGPSSCSACEGSGWVAVPHPAALSEGFMVRGLTMAVACGCDRGQSLAKLDRPPMTLAAYETRNPDWRNQLARWNASLIEAGRRRSEAAHTDRTAGPLIFRLAHKLALPK